MTVGDGRTCRRFTSGARVDRFSGSTPRLGRSSVLGGTGPGAVGDPARGVLRRRVDVGRHGGRSDEKTSDLGYENDVQILSPSAPPRGGDNQAAGTGRSARAGESWWDDAPVPP